MLVFVFACLCDCLFVVYLDVSLFVCWFVCLSGRLFVCLRLFDCLVVRSYGCLIDCPFVRLFVCLVCWCFRSFSFLCSFLPLFRYSCVCLLPWVFVGVIAYLPACFLTCLLDCVHVCW